MSINSPSTPIRTHDLLPFIQDKVYKAKEIGIPSRTIHHWKNEGLLFESHNQEEKNKMLKFSLAEYFWIKTIKICRSYGLSIEDIRIVKKQIIDNVHKFDDKIKDQKNRENLIQSIRETLKDKPKDYIEKEIEGARNYIHHVEVKNRNEFEELLFAILYNRKPSGLLLVKQNKEIQTHVFIESDFNNMSLFYQSHFYVSFDEIFVELGMSEHFKQEQLFNEKEKKSINIIKSIVKSQKAKGINLSVKDGSIDKLDVQLKPPKDKKEIEDYKKKLGSNLKFQTTMFQDEMNLFDFHYTLKISKQ